ncbi:MAG: 50S ribosomal protein L11 methyltransferase [Flavobacteriales bacterium]
MNYTEFKIDIQANFETEPLVFKDILISDLADLGFESFIEDEGLLKAYIETPSFENKTIDFPYLEGKTFELLEVENQNWNAEWESNYPSIEIDGRCIIRAEFHEKPAHIEYDVLIQPKMSFGTGHHQTTHMMTHFLLDEHVENQRVLDMGCGTGVLAILAKMKNASYVEAIDIDEWAYENSIENCALNQTEIVCKQGDAALLGDQKFDVIFANINRNILLNDMKSYAKVLAPKGRIFFSGFYTSDIEQIENEASKYNLKRIDQKEKEHWTALKFEKMN